MTEELMKMGLRFNPFEPSASGAPISQNQWLPQEWITKIEEIFGKLKQGSGVKAVAISGEYGSGKTYVLHWMYKKMFPSWRIRPFYFDNPGVQFYDLANSLLREIGRKNFSKMLWELSTEFITGYQKSLFSRGFEEYLGSRKSSQQRQYNLNELQEAIIKASVTRDDEIAYRLAKIVEETQIKPYFEYRDFVAGKRDALVAENEEAPYFSAILKTLRLASGDDGIAFLIDEFEEISLQKRVSRREAYDYLATLKRLINLTQEENLWLVVSMTPDAVDKTQALEPALWERFTGKNKYHFSIQPLSLEESTQLVRNRIEVAREEGFKPLNAMFPFPDSFPAELSPINRSNPRRLVKICFHLISEGGSTNTPFTSEYIEDIESKAYPTDNTGGES